MVRSRLEGLGPVMAQTLATPLGLSPAAVDNALLALEQEGFVVRGQFTKPEEDSASAEMDWCERGLLARINRYTLKQLRSEIEAVAPADYMRFLFHWQRLEEGEQGEGEEALAAVIAQLEGFAVPAAAWEVHVLPARLRNYRPEMLDRLCTSGRIAWLRAAAPVLRSTAQEGRAVAAPVRVTPIMLLARAHLPHWLDGGGEEENDSPCFSAMAQAVTRCLQDHGASFLDDLVSATGLLRTQVEDALGELVAAGRVTADSYAGLRALVTPAAKKRRRTGHRRAGWAPVDTAGRWSLVQRGQRAQPDRRGLSLSEPHIEAIACTLLRRYGVVFRRVLEREGGLPPWRELLYVYRRLEARGEIRGGRFVAGFSGEQFALPEALATLRGIRHKKTREELITLCAADPLNLTGIITPGRRVPATAGNRVLYRNGVPLALYIGRQVEFLTDLDPARQWQLSNMLLRHGSAAHRARPVALGAAPL